MKRLVFCAFVLVFLGSTVEAQTIKHTEYNEQGRPITFYEGLSRCFQKSIPIVVRAGASACANTLSYNASVGVQFGGFRGLYFAPEIGIDSRGISENNSIARGNLISVEAHNLVLSPIQIGFTHAFYKYSFDFHVALYKSFDYDYDVKCMIDSNYDSSTQEAAEPIPNYNTSDIGYSAGFGFYFYRFNIDLSYKSSFGTMFDNNPFKANIISAKLGFFF